MKPTLYIFVGYPGAGKTTISEVIAEQTGATHLWADHIRRERYGKPLYTQSVNDALYAYLNNKTATLLHSGKSVIFDTNFNYRRDRDLLRKIAADNKAQTVLVWVNTPRDTAEHRATVAPPNLRHRVHGIMTKEHFNEIADKLEPPSADENAFIIDGTDLDHEKISQALMHGI